MVAQGPMAVEGMTSPFLFQSCLSSVKFTTNVMQIQNYSTFFFFFFRSVTIFKFVFVDDYRL